MTKHKKYHKRKSPVAIWEWLISISLTIISGAIVATNESVDLFGKLGYSIQPGLVFLIFGVTFIFSGVWVAMNYLRHKRLI